MVTHVDGRSNSREARLTIPQELMGCFCAMLLLVLAYSSVQTAKTIQGVSDKATHRSARALELMGEINTHLANVRFGYRALAGEIVANSASGQSAGINQISLAMAQVEKATQSVASNAEESAAASQEMFTQTGTWKETADELREPV